MSSILGNLSELTVQMVIMWAIGGVMNTSLSGNTH